MWFAEITSLSDHHTVPLWRGRLHPDSVGRKPGVVLLGQWPSCEISARLLWFVEGYVLGLLADEVPRLRTAACADVRALPFFDRRSRPSSKTRMCKRDCHPGCRPRDRQTY